MKKSIFAVILLLMAGFAAADTEYYFVVDDQSPADDVITIIDAMTHFKFQTTEVAKLNSEVKKKDLENRVTAFVYKGNAAIIVGATSPAEHVVFATDLENYFKQKNILVIQKLSTEVESDDLKSALFTTATKCSDTDNGRIYFHRGTAFGIGPFISDPKYDGSPTDRTDYCEDTDWDSNQPCSNCLVEYYCADNKNMGYERIKCANGCNDGACNPEQVQPKIPETYAVPQPAEQIVQPETATQLIVQPEPVIQPSKPECHGCLVDDNCAPYGSRFAMGTDYVYCDFNKQLTAQKSLGLTCQNNYECTSNQCSDGECISLQQELRETKGMLETIINWLKKIFG